MEKLYQNYLEQIPRQDWEKTPASVKKLLEKMVQRIENLEKSQAEVLALHQQLLEQVNRTSKNSSSPPSQDPPGFEKKPKKQKNKKAGRNVEVNQVMTVTVGTYIMSG